MNPPQLQLQPSLDGRPAASLRRGRDLVLEIDAGDGLDLPDGVLAIDYVPVAERRRIDELALAALAQWQRACGQALTLGDLSLAWLWETDLILEAFLPTVRQALAMRAALTCLSPAAVALTDGDRHTQALLSEVARVCNVAVQAPGRVVPDTRRPPSPRPRLSAADGARRAALGAARWSGVPTSLRPGSVLVFGYWPLTALFDRLLDAPGQRPAFSFDKPPVGPARSLRAGVQGGWLGTPGPRARRHAALRMEALLARIGAATSIDVDGMDLGSVLHERALAVARNRGAGDIARAGVLRRALASGRVRRVVIPSDMVADMRLVAHIARACGVPTLLLAHGAYPIRHTLVDMQVADDIALWSRTFGPTHDDGCRALHVVGYPDSPVVARPAGTNNGAPRVLVIGRATEMTTAMIDERYVVRHYAAAIEGVRAACPDADIVLRPHPGESHRAAPRVAREYTGVRVDSRLPVLEALGQADLCVGTASTASFQAALVGVPVVVLNLTGYRWEPPLDGSGDVPVPTSAGELERVVAAWSAGAGIGGRPELLVALGADSGQGPGDSVDRLMAIIG